MNILVYNESSPCVGLARLGWDDQKVLNSISLVLISEAAPIFSLTLEFTHNIINLLFCLPSSRHIFERRTTQLLLQSSSQVLTPGFGTCVLIKTISTLLTQ